jgi:hypothetical protein
MIAPGGISRELLYNPEAEQYVLGAILNDNQVYHRVATLIRPEDFGNALHFRIFAEIGKLIGLKINEVPVFVGDKDGWANLPGKPILDADGRHKIDANSKPIHGALAEWRNQELADGFSHAVVAAVRQPHPNDFVD